MPIGVQWRAVRFDEGFRADIMVENQVIIERKSVEFMWLDVNALTEQEPSWRSLRLGEIQSEFEYDTTKAVSYLSFTPHSALLGSPIFIFPLPQIPRLILIATLLLVAELVATA